LISPPDDVAAADHEFGAPGLDVLHDLSRHPVTALKPEHRPVNAGKQFHVLDGGLRDPSLVHRHRHDFGLRFKRHDDLDEVFADRIVDHLHIALHHRFRHLSRHHQTEHFDEQLGQVALAVLDREVHHWSRVAIRRKRKSGAGRRRRNLLGHRSLRLKGRKQRNGRQEHTTVDAG
jgi:hypothetical protein